MTEKMIELIKKQAPIGAVALIFVVVYYLGQFVAGQKYLYLAMLFVLALGLIVLLRPKKILYALIISIPFSFIVKQFLLLRAPRIIASITGIYKDVLIVFLFAAILSVVFVKKYYVFKWSRLHLPILTFTGLCVLLFLVNSQTYLIGIIGLRRTIICVFMFFFVLYLFKSKKDIKTFTLCVLLVGIVAAIISIVQVTIFPETMLQASSKSGDLYFSFKRVNAFFSSANDLAFYLAYLIALLIGLMNYSFKRKNTMFYAFAFFILTVALVVTLSRGAWISLFLAVLVWGVMKYKLAIRRIGIIAVVLLSISLIFASNPLVANRFSSIFDSKGGSRKGRITKFYRYAKYEDFKSFLFGKGLGATGSVPEAFEEQGLKSNFIDIYYVELYQDIGAVGLACYGWVLLAYCALIIRIEKGARDPFLKGLANGLIIATFTFILSGLFFTIGGFFVTASIFWSFGGIAVIIDRHHIADGPRYEISQNNERHE